MIIDSPQDLHDHHDHEDHHDHQDHHDHYDHFFCTSNFHHHHDSFQNLCPFEKILQNKIQKGFEYTLMKVSLSKLYQHISIFYLQTKIYHQICTIFLHHLLVCKVEKVM